MNQKVVFVIIVVLLLLLTGGGVYMVKRGNAPTPTPTPTMFGNTEPTPEPTVEQNVDITKFKIKVLNGTAIAGLAGKTQTALQTAGFTVSGTGNADTKDHTTVEIQAKSTVPASVLTKLKDEISKTYTIGADKTLDSSNEDDIVVVLGANQPTPTAGAKSTTPVPTSSVTKTPTPSGTAVTPTATPTSAPTPTKSQ